METLGLFLIALLVLGFGFISGRVQRTVLTPPMIFTAAGLLLGSAILSHESLSPESPGIHLLAELTLVLVLFTDASRIDLHRLRREHNLPVRLLGLGMPLTVILGAAVASYFFHEIGFWGAAVLAAILAPTDAALGQAVVTEPEVPVRIRQTLNVESGLNDGIAFPLVLILVCAGEAAHDVAGAYWVRFIAMQLVLGPAAGIAVGLLGGKLVERSYRRGWMNESFRDLSALALSILAYAGATLIGGNGFIAAFVAGLTLGNFVRGICGSLVEFAEAEGQLLTLLVFLVFGAVMVPVALEHAGWAAVLYGALSLTVIRLLPVALSLVGVRLRWETVLFLGWFGPRGIASILFALLVVEGSSLPGREEILTVVVTTVCLSILAHGLTAVPASRWYSARVMTAMTGDEPEHMEVSEMPTRMGG